MQITIDHETVYTYESPVGYSIQSLRLTPQPFDGQAVRSWSVESDLGGLLHSFTDSFGNLTHTLVIDTPHTESRIRVRGQVDTTDTNGVLSGTPETFPPLFYLRETYLTAPDGAIRGLARAALAASSDTLNCLHRLTLMIRDAIDYRVGETEVTTTAAEAMAAGAGVCQDHAHVLIAGARALDIPARYVSGYLLNTADRAESEAAHAWAEALVPDLGWVAFDVANGVCADASYVRIGVGLDYRAAAPIRGVRRGGGEETLDVAVHVAPSANGSF